MWLGQLGAAGRSLLAAAPSSRDSHSRLGAAMRAAQRVASADSLRLRVELELGRTDANHSKANKAAHNARRWPWPAHWPEWSRNEVVSLID